MWFQNIENTDISLFIKFDIVDFYPSISKDLLINAIKFAKSITPIDDNIIKTIVHACFQNLSGPESKKIKKKLCKIFKKRRLNITIEYNLRITDFLDVTFHLRTGKYYPYRKVNNEFYIFTSNQTTDHLSPSKFLPWSVKEYLMFHVIKSALIKLPLTKITHLKTAVSTKISNSLHNLLLKEQGAAEIFYGLTCCLAPTWRPTLSKYFCDS